MTIAELKILIEDLPDDMVVVTQHNKHEFFALHELWTETKTLYGPYPELYSHPIDEYNSYQALVLNRE